MRTGVLILAGLGILLSGCGDKERLERLAQQNSELKEEVQKLSRQQAKVKSGLKFLAERAAGVKARIETNHGNIDLGLFPDKAPIHCFTFITRAESGFYDGTQFHRIIPGFMIQGGDPNTKDDDPLNDGTGGPLLTIPHEFNDVSHRRGTLSTARVPDKSAGAGSQFFIMHGDQFGLDREYTAFGKVTAGMDVVDRIASVQTVQNNPRLQDHPVKPVIIKTIRVFR